MAVAVPHRYIGNIDEIRKMFISEVRLPTILATPIQKKEYRKTYSAYHCFTHNPKQWVIVQHCQISQDTEAPPPAVPTNPMGPPKGTEMQC